MCRVADLEGVEGSRQRRRRPLDSIPTPFLRGSAEAASCPKPHARCARLAAYTYHIWRARRCGRRGGLVGKATNRPPSGIIRGGSGRHVKQVDQIQGPAGRQEPFSATYHHFVVVTSWVPCRTALLVHLRDRWGLLDDRIPICADRPRCKNAMPAQGASAQSHGVVAAARAVMLACPGPHGIQTKMVLYLNAQELLSIKLRACRGV